MNILLVIAILFNTTSFQSSAILEYDKKVKLTNLTDDEKYPFLFNKSLIDEVKIQLLVESSVIVGATWTDYFTGETRYSSVFPIPDGLYTMVGRSVVQRCYTNEVILSAFKGVTCTCNCKTDVVTKEIIRTEIEYQVSWGWTVLGFTVGVGLGVGLGFLLLN